MTKLAQEKPEAAFLLEFQEPIASGAVHTTATQVQAGTKTVTEVKAESNDADRSSKVYSLLAGQG